MSIFFSFSPYRVFRYLCRSYPYKITVHLQLLVFNSFNQASRRLKLDVARLGGFALYTLKSINSASHNFYYPSINRLHRCLRPSLLLGDLRQAYFFNSTTLSNFTHLIDVGANVGEVSYICIKEGIKNIICIEPSPHEFACLKHNLSHLENNCVISYHQNAIWHHDTLLNLSIKSDSADNHVVERNTDQSLEVTAYTLDHFISPLPDDTTVLLKIETEGFEPEAILGISDSSFNKIAAITVDMGPERPPFSSNTVADVSRLLFAKGFVLTHFDHVRCTGYFQPLTE